MKFIRIVIIYLLRNYNNYYLRKMIFRSMLNKVLQGISNIGPVKNLIKYILDRSLNQLLSDQISLQDFKNGQLLLTNISLNLDKINNQYLLSSPYIIHHGNIRKLKIILPGWTELSSKSIELAAEGLQLDFKPNKQFADNFKNAMQQKQEDITIQQVQEPGELKQSNPMDFFRQLVKQIILNMKIKIQNTVMRLFINEPSKQNSSKPQYYSMFRIPLLSIGKNEDKISIKVQDVEQIKFDLLIPQMSLHLLREGALFPQYSKQEVKQGDFPFLYPPVNHPSCILLIGKSSQKNDNVIKLTITLTTYFKKQKKLMEIQGKIGSVQMTIDPIQLKIISRFFAQIKQFQKVFESVMIELGLRNEQNQLIGLGKKDSKSKPNNDLLSSIMISITEHNLRSSVSKQNEIYNSMMLVPQLANAANQFNQQAADKLRKSGQYKGEEGLININFKQQSKTNFSLNNFQANFLKYVTVNSHEKLWLTDIDSEGVNQHLGCSHFRLALKGLNYTFSSKQNLHEVKMSYIKLHDIRLKNSLNYQFNSSISEQFYDIQASNYYKMNVNQDYFTIRPQLITFKLQKDQHYCLQELFRLSEGQSPQVNNDKLKTYSFMPAGAQCSQGAGLVLKFNGDSKTLKIDVKDVAVMVNFQLWKDVLNIIFPIFLYKKLAQRINIQSQEINMSEIKEKNVKFNQLFESQYKFTGKYIQQMKAKQQKLQLRIKIGLIYCFYRETIILKTNKEDFLNQVEKKVIDCDNFSKQCFCSLNQRAIYAEIHDFQFVKIEKQFNLTIEEVKAGLLSLQNSRISSDIKPILVCEKLRVEENKLQQKKQMASIIMNTRVFISSLNFSVQLPSLITFIDMVKKTIKIIDCLQNFKKNLKSKLLFIQQELFNVEKVVKQKVKNQRVFEILIGEVQLRMLLLSAYCKNIFFRNKQDEKQLKFSSFAIGLAKKMDLRLGQFQNVLQTQQYDFNKASYKGIKDVNLLIQIGRQFKNKKQIILRNTSKLKRLEKKLQFFADLDKSHKQDAIFNPSLHFYIKQKVFSQSENRKSGSKFQFRKKPNEPGRKNSIIQQEKHIKNIDIIPIQPIYIHVGNLTHFLQLKTQVQSTINKVKSVLDEISSQSRQLIQRKNSQQYQQESIFDVSLKLQRCFVNLDLKPDFIYKQQTNQRVLSNTRAFISLQIQNLSFLFNPDLSKSNISLSFNKELYFLHYTDKNIQLNPLLLYKHELQKNLGFKKLITINEISIKVQAIFNQNIINIEQFKIDALQIQMSMSTIPLLQLFIQHFVQHNMLGNFGIDEEDWNFQLLQPEKIQREDQVQDLTNKLQQLQSMIQKKNISEKQFLNHEYSINDNKGEGTVSLKKFRILKGKMRIYDTQDFKFDEYDSLFESKSIERIRSKVSQINKVIELEIQKFDIRAEKSSTKTQILFDCDRLELNFQFNRRESLLWGQNKLHSICLLKLDSPLKILAHMSREETQVKVNKLQLTVNLTDQIFQLVQKYTEKTLQINKSNWKQNYESHENKKQNSMSMSMLLFSLPKGKITASVEYKRAKLLNEINLKTKPLLVHEQSSNIQGIMKLINDWCMNIFTQNVGKLVSGALFQVISACIGLFLNGIKHFLSLFFPSLKKDK